MKKYFPLALCLFIAFVFLQSLPFKFSNSLETQHIFQTLGEWSGLAWFGQYGGYMIGVAELITAIVLFKWRTIGAVMALGIMSGAIIFHLFTPLGIIMPLFDAETTLQNGDDGGVLFMMACATWVCSLILIILDMKNPDGCINKLLKKSAH